MLGSNLDIMSPQWTDVIFKNRNKEYGAYQLRKENSRTTNRALIIAASVFVVVLATPTVINIIKGFIPKADPIVKITEVELKSPPPIEAEPVKPPPVQKQVVAQHDMIEYKPMVVKPDIEAERDPPTDKQLEVADPGPKTLKGDPNAEVVIDEKQGNEAIKGITESDNSNEVFKAVEINPEYPGGEAAFGKFLQSHIRYPPIAKENGTQGRVFLQFVVERDGSLTDMKIVRDPGSGLGEEAVRVLKISPHWKPGIQNGKAVRVQYTVPVNFALAD
jgi:protein TonB